jgi:hypothetical protein
MSDERDETRQFAPSDDATEPGDPSEPDDPSGDDHTVADPGRVTPVREDAAEGRPDTGPEDDSVGVPSVRDDAHLVRPEVSRAGDPAADEVVDAEAVPPVRDAATVPGPDVTQVDGVARPDDDAAGGDDVAGGDVTVADPGRVPPVRDDATVVRPDATSVMPPATDEWAPARGNPAWTGRAEVRAPRPSGVRLPEDDWAVVAAREPRDRWWMPIVVGIIALVLLAALAFGIYLIVQNSGADETPAPTVSTTVVPTATSTGSTAVTTEPTTAPTSTAPTTEPTSTEVTIPALIGLSLPDAQAALSRMGLQRYKVIYRDDDAQPGTVIGSDPAEGQEVPPDTTVTLVVAKQSTSSPTATATTTGSTQEPGGVGN